MSKKVKIIIITIVFILAVCLVLYPVISNIYNAWVESKLIADYDETIAEIEEADYTLEWEKAWAYESWFASGFNEESRSDYFEGMTSDEAYESVLNVMGSGMMGYVVIPSINVSLPVYHYATDEVLERGVGHLDTSDLPIGGDGTHSILTGHRGLPGSTLFTDLDQVSEGDIFYVKILDETLAYIVTDITVVEPTDVEVLTQPTDDDLCTLLTCTPYGINTHRLLVTGTRTDYIEEEAAADIASVSQISISSTNWVLIMVALLEIVVYILAVRIINRDYA